MTSKQLTKYQITNQINRVLGYEFLLCDSMYSKSELFEIYNEVVIKEDGNTIDYKRAWLLS